MRDLMDSSEKLLLHQIHPAKLAVDIAGSALSTWLFWRHQWALALLSTFPPSILATVLLFKFADFESLRNSRAGQYVLSFMNRPREALRFLGQGIMWFGAWIYNPFVLAAGVLLIICAWLSGLFRKNLRK